MKLHNNRKTNEQEHFCVENMVILAFEVDIHILFPMYKMTKVTVFHIKMRHGVTLQTFRWRSTYFYSKQKAKGYSEVRVFVSFLND